MSPEVLEVYLVAMARPNAEVIADYVGPDLSLRRLPAPKKERPRVVGGPGKGNRTIRRAKRRAVGRGICSYCKRVALVHQVHGRLCCAVCP